MRRTTQRTSCSMGILKASLDLPRMKIWAVLGDHHIHRLYKGSNFLAKTGSCFESSLSAASPQKQCGSLGGLDISGNFTLSSHGCYNILKWALGLLETAPLAQAYYCKHSLNYLSLSFLPTKWWVMATQLSTCPTSYSLGELNPLKWSHTKVRVSLEKKNHQNQLKPNLWVCH